MSNYQYGIEVPSKYSSSLESYLENNNIKYQYWTDNEFLFATEADRKKASKWIERLEKLDK